MRGAPSLALVGLLLGALPALACDTCRPAVRAGIFNADFPGRLLLTLLPLVATLVLVGLVHRFCTPRRASGPPKEGT